MAKNKIFISAGEISGDNHASELMKNFQMLQSVEFYGLGGPAMKAAGLMGIQEDTSTLNTIGHLESLRFIRRKINHLKLSLEIIKKFEIQNIILVDNQGFNLILGKKAREMGLQVFYYIPPQVSVWGAWNAAKVAGIAHHILPFLHSDMEIYTDKGAHLFYPGNPVIDKISEFSPKPDFLCDYGFNKNKTVISLFPGSRFQELNTLLDVFLKAAKILIEEHDCQILLSVAHPDFKPLIDKGLSKYDLQSKIGLVEQNALQAIYHSQVNIMASGTATLESALLGRWPLICYKISAISYAIGKKLVTKQMIGLPNILLDNKYFPELLQKDLNPSRLVEETLQQINRSADDVNLQQQTYQQLRQLCGKPGVAQRAAEYIMRNLKHAPHSGH